MSSDRAKLWADIQRRQAEGKTLFLGDTKWLFAEVALLREELSYWKSCAEQNNRETNDYREKSKRLESALKDSLGTLQRITLEPTFIADGCPGVQRTRYVVGHDVKDTALEGAHRAKDALAREAL